MEQFQGLSCTVILLPSAPHQGIAVGRREAAELDVGALAPDGRHLRGGAGMKMARKPSR